MAFGFPQISFIGYPLSVPCAGHAGLGLREGGVGDTPDIVAHLQSLTPEDRHLRFCGTLSDEAIEAHAATLASLPGFTLIAREGPLWDGTYYKAGPVRACSELVVSGRTAELGISVDADHRRAGVGTYLVQTAARLLALRGVDQIVAVTLSRNAAMIRLGQTCGARIERDGSDVLIVFSVPTLHRAYLARRTAQVLVPAPWTRPRSYVSRDPG